MNTVEFGNGLFGAEAAARQVFGTSAAELSNAQAALLAAVLPSPNASMPARRARTSGAARRGFSSRWPACAPPASRWTGGRAGETPRRAAARRLRGVRPAARPTAARDRGGDRHDAAGCHCGYRHDRVQLSVRDRRGAARARRAGSHRVHEPQLRQRVRQRGAEQPPATGPALPGIRRLPAAGPAAGHRRVPGRRADQRAVRRHGELGADPADRDRVRAPDAGIQSAVRTQRARRRHRHPHQGRVHLPGQRRGDLRRLVRENRRRGRDRRAARRRLQLLPDRHLSAGRRLAGLLAHAGGSAILQAGVAVATDPGRREPEPRGHRSHRQRARTRRAARAGQKAGLHPTRPDTERADASESRARPCDLRGPVGDWQRLRARQ